MCDEAEDGAEDFAPFTPTEATCSSFSFIVEEIVLLHRLLHSAGRDRFGKRGEPERNESAFVETEEQNCGLAGKS